MSPRTGQAILADKGYRSAELEVVLTSPGAILIRPAFRNETPAAATSSSDPHTGQPLHRSLIVYDH